MLELYRNIKKLRLEKGWTQQEFAEKLGYKDRTMISKIEKGQVDLPLTKIMDISKLFDIDPNDLFGDIPEAEKEIARVELENVMLLKKYNRLTPEHKSVINNMVNQLLSLQSDNK